MAATMWCKANAKVIAEATRGVFAAMPENAPDRDAAGRCIAVARKGVAEFRRHALGTPAADHFDFLARQYEFWLGRLEESLAPDLYSYDVSAASEVLEISHSVLELIECDFNFEKAERPYWTAVPKPE